MFQHVLLISVVCVSVLSERNYDRQQYTRIKRGKYYSSPLRYYGRPPSSYSSRGVFSYTPPPSHMIGDESPYPGYPGILGNVGFPSNPGSFGSSGPYRPKVSKPEGLDDDDLNNLIKHLSKSDLDKIIQMTGRDRDSERYNQIKGLLYDSEHYKTSDDERFDRHKDYIEKPKNFKAHSQTTDKFKISEDETNFFKTMIQEVDLENKLNNEKFFNYVTPPTTNIYDSFNQYQNTLDTEESMRTQQFSDTEPPYSIVEENLPKPKNLRPDDYEISFTRNVPKVVKAEGAYEVKNFGNLPLMNYNSKLDTLSSYHVPHYTVTSSKSAASSYSSPAVYSSPLSLPSKVPFEPAPPPSEAKSQSDAHLKAIKIWTHKSSGTAYTLHDDGTLSLEKPGRPRVYGYS